MMGRALMITASQYYTITARWRKKREMMNEEEAQFPARQQPADAV